MTTRIEMITDDQLQEHANRVIAPFCELTSAEYQQVREDQDYKSLVSQLWGKTQRIIAWRFPLGASVPVNSLQGLRYSEANLQLSYDWSTRDSEEERYERIKAYYAAQLGISAFDLVETGPQDIPGWQHILVISPVDLAVYSCLDLIGQKPAHATAYCEAARPLTIEIPILQKSDWIKKDCLGKDGARLEANSARQWQSLPDPQQYRSPLKVRRMSVNPATWFSYDATQYSVAPKNVRVLANSFIVGSKVRSAACGDLIAFASLAIGEPQILNQIALGTCPRTDIPGTELRYGQVWLYCPHVLQNGDEAWLNDNDADDAHERFGSFLVAGE